MYIKIIILSFNWTQNFLEIFFSINFELKLNYKKESINRFSLDILKKITHANLNLIQVHQEDTIPSETP